MTICFGFNQVFDTDIDIPGAVSARGNAQSENVICVKTGPSYNDADAPLYALTDGAVVFSAREVARYRCTDDSIEVNPFPGADPDWVSGLLVATAIPAALWMQQRFVLHAAAIVPKGASRAIAIAGASGAGKSVLARQLLDLGASLLADDSVAIELGATDIMASGLPGGTHRSIDDKAERQFESVSSARSARSAPLGAVIILDGFADNFEARRLDKVEAVGQIIAHQHRPRIPAALGRAGPVLAQAAAIAERIPVSIWRRCKNELPLSVIEQETLSALINERPYLLLLSPSRKILAVGCNMVQICYRNPVAYFSFGTPFDMFNCRVCSIPV